MKQVSLRDFQLNANNYLEALPIILTRYNIPVAEVHPIGSRPDKSVNTVTPDLSIRCLAPNANCKRPAELLMTYENPETFEIESNPFCREHAGWLSKTYEIIKEEELNAVS